MKQRVAQSTSQSLPCQDIHNLEIRVSTARKVLRLSTPIALPGNRHSLIEMKYGLIDYVIRYSCYAPFRTKKLGRLSSAEEFVRVSNFIGARKAEMVNNLFDTQSDSSVRGYLYCPPSTCSLQGGQYYCQRSRICPHCWGRYVVSPSVRSLIRLMDFDRRKKLNRTVTVVRLRSRFDDFATPSVAHAHFVELLKDRFGDQLAGSMICRRLYPSKGEGGLSVSSGVGVVVAFENADRRNHRDVESLFSSMRGRLSVVSETTQELAQHPKIRVPFFSSVLGAALSFPREMLFDTGDPSFFESWRSRTRFPRTVDRSGKFRGGNKGGKRS